ncbi:MAG: hypothetical protein ACR2L5_00360 [Candidatus Actinomarinaceae bacterium]
MAKKTETTSTSTKIKFLGAAPCGYEGYGRNEYEIKNTELEQYKNVGIYQIEEVK